MEKRPKSTSDNLDAIRKQMKLIYIRWVGFNPNLGMTIDRLELIDSSVQPSTKFVDLEYSSTRFEQLIFGRFWHVSSSWVSPHLFHAGHYFGLPINEVLL